MSRQRTDNTNAACPISDAANVAPVEKENKSLEVDPSTISTLRGLVFTYRHSFVVYDKTARSEPEKQVSRLLTSDNSSMFNKTKASATLSQVLQCKIGNYTANVCRYYFSIRWMVLNDILVQTVGAPAECQRHFLILSIVVQSVIQPLVAPQ
jgi:hypothetical protein